MLFLICPQEILLFQPLCGPLHGDSYIFMNTLMYSLDLLWPHYEVSMQRDRSRFEPFQNQEGSGFRWVTTHRNALAIGLLRKSCWPYHDYHHYYLCSWIKLWLLTVGVWTASAFLMHYTSGQTWVWGHLIRRSQMASSNTRMAIYQDDTQLLSLFKTGLGRNIIECL